MGQQDVFDLLGIDVDPAGHDHEGPAVGEVEVAVLVDPADVAERAPGRMGGMLRRARLGRVAVVLERRRRVLEVHGPGLPHRDLVARRRHRCG